MKLVPAAGSGERRFDITYIACYGRLMKEFECMGCDVNTSDIGEYYMVTDKLWAKAASAYASIDNRGMLCIGCLEEAIGRTLLPTDFKRVPLNYGWTNQSARLVDRIGPNGPRG